MRGPTTLTAILFSIKGGWTRQLIIFKRPWRFSLNPRTFHDGLGNALYQKGRMDEAIIQYQKALVLQPKSAAAYEYLGEALFQKGQMDGAIIQYQKALEIKPDFAEAHNNLGSSLLQMGRVNGAITHFQRALEIKPDFVEAHNNLGNQSSPDGAGGRSDCLLSKGH